MTSGTVTARLPAEPLGRGLSSGVPSVHRGERRKLAAQLSTRLLAFLCAIGPLAFAAILGAQSGSPADTLFGVWVHSSGFAISLVVLSFAGSWGFRLWSACSPATCCRPKIATERGRRC
jgi:ABC-2 type transport system permease protein